MIEQVLEIMRQPEEPAVDQVVILAEVNQKVDITRRRIPCPGRRRAEDL